MGVLAVALAMWAAVYLFAYEREYAGVPVEAGRVMVMEGSVEAFSGKSVLFRPDGSRWLYAVSSRDGACPLEAGERYRIRGEAYPLQAPCGPGIFDRERWGYLHGIIAGIRLDEYCRNGPGDWRSRFRAFSLRLRERAASLLREGAPPDDEARQVMVSAVLGDKTDARPETMAKFLESGCMHVFAVSGMHVGVAAMLVLGMLRLLHVYPRAAMPSAVMPGAVRSDQGFREMKKKELEELWTELMRLKPLTVVTTFLVAHPVQNVADCFFVRLLENVICLHDK